MFINDKTVVQCRDCQIQNLSFFKKMIYYINMTVEYNIPKSIAELREQLERTLLQLGIPSSMVFLTSIMAGRDPRPMEAPIKEMVRKPHMEFLDGTRETPHPTDDEWLEISDHVLSSGLYDQARVGLRESVAAAKEVTKYTTATQKHETVVQGSGGPVELPELTEAEVEVFWGSKFKDLF